MLGNAHLLQVYVVHRLGRVNLFFQLREKLIILTYLSY